MKFGSYCTTESLALYVMKLGSTCEYVYKLKLQQL
jgi:hypothetical protein